jgi:hypothetical protein
MGGSKGGGQAINQQNAITQQELALEQQQAGQSNQLYNLTEPGIASAEQYYSQLASGNPQAIQTATAPATQAIAANYNQAATNMSQNMPRGGAKDLAVQEAQISKAGAIGGTEAQAYTGAFPALASLGTAGVGLSVNEISQALSAFSGASSSNQAVIQAKTAGKGQTLGLIGGLAGDVAGIAGAKGGGGGKGGSGGGKGGGSGSGSGSSYGSSKYGSGSYGSSYGSGSSSNPGIVGYGGTGYGGGGS